MTGYLGWWRIKQGEALRESNQGETDKYRREGESQEQAKMKFLNNFYHSACRTPRCSQRIIGGGRTEDTPRERNTHNRWGEGEMSSATTRNRRADNFNTKLKV